MRWQRGRRSDNIIDARGGRGMRRAGGIGLIGTIVILGISWLTGINPAILMGGAQLAGVGGGGQSELVQGSPEEEQLKEFVSVVLADTEDVWHQVFNEMGQRYREPKLVLFTDKVESACGFASAASGPFYCPGDQQVYLDLAFFDQLSRRFGAPGDFAQAYVIAHEVGHHVQTLLGISGEVSRLRRQVNKTQGNQLSVMQELQADCFAGVWANRAQKARNILEQGDIEEGLQAAAAVGDDTIQKRTRGFVVPDGFTHGSAEQRQRWFVQGLRSGDAGQCDTFNAPAL